MFVSDTILKTEYGKTISGLYKVNIDELDADKPARIKPYVDENNHDAHPV